ncbi:MAG TPA: alginate export family protein [Chthonomonas sp.]|uniref:alginate export family protein n=1 Tax=Chthonomonas sp. TaxID=2282153 RepID=UPI002B4B29A3|nr:alginate export family protein [Chthonomonas sp.]HLI48732.1 alginate export family protein [Chthonomonas sp.]
MRFFRQKMFVLLCTVVFANFFAINASSQTVVPSNGHGFSFSPEWRIRNDESNSAIVSTGNTAYNQEWISRLRLGFGWSDPSGLALFLQPQYSWGNTTNSGHIAVVNDFDVFQGYAQGGKGRYQWRLGRQVLAFGDGRLIASPEWNNYGRTFDAARFTFKSARQTTDLFFGKIGFANGVTTVPTLYGVYRVEKFLPKLSSDLYALLKNDRVSGANLSVFTLGARPVIDLIPHTHITIEPAFQFGHFGGKAIGAWAYAAVATYTFPGPSALHFVVEHDFASGGSPTDPAHYETFDQLFPSTHGKSGILDYMGWRNMRHWHVGMGFAATKRLTLSVDGHFLSLADGRDYWYGVNGAPVKGSSGKPLWSPTGAAGRDIGSEVDVVADYRVSAYLGLSIGYSHFWPGHYIKTLDPAQAHEVNWFYVQPTYRF